MGELAAQCLLDYRTGGVWKKEQVRLFLRSAVLVSSAAVFFSPGLLQLTDGTILSTASALGTDS